MTRASTICRYLLGVIFTVFGANGFLQFLKQPPPSTAFATQFLGAAVGSHFMVAIFAFQLIAGVLLLVGRYVPLALVVLAGVLVNILLYHLTMDPPGIGAGLLATVLWFVAALNYRGSFRGILAPTADARAR